MARSRHASVCMYMCVSYTDPESFRSTVPPGAESTGGSDRARVSECALQPALQSARGGPGGRGPAPLDSCMLVPGRSGLKGFYCTPGRVGIGAARKRDAQGRRDPFAVTLPGVDLGAVGLKERSRAGAQRVPSASRAQLPGRTGEARARDSGGHGEPGGAAAAAAGFCLLPGAGQWPR